MADEPHGSLPEADSGMPATSGNEPSDAKGRPAGKNTGSSKAPSRDDLRNQESKAETPTAAGSTDEGASFWKEPNNKPKGGLGSSTYNFLLGTRRRKTIFGSGVVGTIAGLVLMFSVASGPLQFIHIGQLLTQQHFATQNSQQNDRLMHEVRFWRYTLKGQTELTRMGLLGNTVGNYFESHLNNSGLTSLYSDKFGLFNGYQIDTTSKDSPFHGWSDEEIKAAVKAETGIDIVRASEIKTIGSGIDPKAWVIPADKMNYLDTLKLNYKLLRASGKSTLAAAEGARLLCVRAACTSFLSPMTIFENKAKAKIEAKSWFQREQTAVENGSTANSETAKGSGSKDTQTAADTLNGLEAEKGDPAKLSIDLKSTAFTGAAGVGLACMIYSINERASSYKQAQVEMPLIRMGMLMLGMGSQIESGHNVNTAEMAQLAQQLNGKGPDGKSTSWRDAATFGGGVAPSGTLTSINSSGGPFQGFVDAVNKYVPMGTICSGVVQGILGGIQLVVDAFTGDTAQVIAGAITSTVAGTVVQDQLVSWVSGHAVDISAVGADFGNEISYGAALAANNQSLAAGGRLLTKSESTQLANAQTDFYNSQFAKQNLAYRLFSPKDPRSAFAKLIDNSSTSPSRNFARIGASLFNFHHIFSSIGDLFSGHAHAASGSFDYYDNGLPQVGFSTDEMNNAPNNPYQNAQQVTDLLNGPTGGSYVKAAKDCFGVDITQLQDGSSQWDVSSEPNSSPRIYSNGQYTSLNCSSAPKDTDAADWLKVRFFIMDMETMDSMACYAGDDTNTPIAQACSDIGFAASSSSSPTGGSGGSSGSTNPVSGKCSGGQQYSALVGSGASFAGIDQGVDFVPASGGGFDICAPADGTITLADQTGHHYDRTNGQALVIEKLAKAPGVPSSSQYVYFAELISIDSSIKVGVHVSKGDLIGHNNQSPGIELGWGTDATHGFLCQLGVTLGSATPCGQSFDRWVVAGGG